MSSEVTDDCAAGAFAVRAFATGRPGTVGVVASGGIEGRVGRPGVGPDGRPGKLPGAPSPWPAGGGPPDAGPWPRFGPAVTAEFRSGIGFVWQGTSGRYGGRVPGQRGRTPAGGEAGLPTSVCPVFVRPVDSVCEPPPAGSARTGRCRRSSGSRPRGRRGRVPELLVVLDAGGEGPVLDLGCRPRAGVRTGHLANRFCLGKKLTAASVARAKVARGRAEVAVEATQLVRADQGRACC
jgi:hypothetical protein